MKKQVLFVILDRFADHEYPFLAMALQKQHSPYEVKTLSVKKEPIKSIGGFTVIPDYCAADYPPDYAGLILIGGNSWRGEEAKKIVPLLKQADESGKLIGAICDATVFLGMNGLLNERRHTSNTLEGLVKAAQENYSGQEYYINEQAVRDGNLVTANGTAYLEFTKEILMALSASPMDQIEENYQFYKFGYIEMMKKINDEKTNNEENG